MFSTRKINSNSRATKREVELNSGKCFHETKCSHKSTYVAISPRWNGFKLRFVITVAAIVLWLGSLGTNAIVATSTTSVAVVHNF